uniref:Uncharacterized protein n=1 Tax=Noctiluca scintillans TaxID=2966 RepID=A0A7S1AX59_NOCSC
MGDDAGPEIRLVDDLGLGPRKRRKKDKKVADAPASSVTPSHVAPAGADVASAEQGPAPAETAPHTAVGPSEQAEVQQPRGTSGSDVAEADPGGAPVSASAEHATVEAVAGTSIRPTDPTPHTGEVAAETFVATILMENEEEVNAGCGLAEIEGEADDVLAGTEHSLDDAVDQSAVDGVAETGEGVTDAVDEDVHEASEGDAVDGTAEDGNQEVEETLESPAADAPAFDANGLTREASNVTIESTGQGAEGVDQEEAASPVPDAGCENPLVTETLPEEANTSNENVDVDALEPDDVFLFYKPFWDLEAKDRCTSSLRDLVHALTAKIEEPIELKEKPKISSKAGQPKAVGKADMTNSPWAFLTAGRPPMAGKSGRHAKKGAPIAVKAGSPIGAIGFKLVGPTVMTMKAASPAKSGFVPPTAKSAKSAKAPVRIGGPVTPTRQITTATTTNGGLKRPISVPRQNAELPAWKKMARPSYERGPR